MTISAAFVLFSVLWFLILFIILPLNLKTQQEKGFIVDGTPASAPYNPRMKKKFLLVTVITLVIWLPICLIIMSGFLTISDLDFYDRLITKANI